MPTARSSQSRNARLPLLVYCLSLAVMFLLAILRVDGLVAFMPGMLAVGAFIGTSYYKELNGTAVRELGGVGALRENPEGPSDAVPVATVLRRYGISPEVYGRYRAALVGMSYQRLEVHPGYVALVEGGMLDNLHGVVYVRPGHAPPGIGSHFLFEEDDLVALRPLGGSWYEFGTT